MRERGLPGDCNSGRLLSFRQRDPQVHPLSKTAAAHDV